MWKNHPDWGREKVVREIIHKLEKSRPDLKIYFVDLNYDHISILDKLYGTFRPIFLEKLRIDFIGGRGSQIERVGERVRKNLVNNCGLFQSLSLTANQISNTFLSIKRAFDPPWFKTEPLFPTQTDSIILYHNNFHVITIFLR